MIDASHLAVRVPSTLAPFKELVDVFCQETPGDWRVRIEGDVVLAECGKELGFQMARDGIVIPLIHSWQNIALLLGNSYDFLDLLCEEIR